MATPNKNEITIDDIDNIETMLKAAFTETKKRPIACNNNLVAGYAFDIPLNSSTVDAEKLRGVLDSYANKVSISHTQDATVVTVLLGKTAEKEIEPPVSSALQTPAATSGLASPIVPSDFGDPKYENRRQNLMVLDSLDPKKIIKWECTNIDWGSSDHVTVYRNKTPLAGAIDTAEVLHDVMKIRQHGEPKSISIARSDRLPRFINILESEMTPDRRALLAQSLSIRSPGLWTPFETLSDFRKRTRPPSKEGRSA